MIYDLALMCNEPIDPWPGRYGQAHRALRLLRANRSIHREASSVFYGRNCFDLSDATPDLLDLFFGQIGANNAGHIRHVWIGFPQFLRLDHGDVAFDDATVGILANIQKSCANLTALTTSLDSTHSLELRLDELDHHGVVVEALELVNTSFRATLAVQDITVSVYSDAPSDYIRTVMERCGWTLSITEYVEEPWQDGMDYFDDNDYHGFQSSSEDDFDEEYDIDNDSDFWRRAAD